MQDIIEQIAAELQVRAAQVSAAVALLDGGDSVPFVARYRKEATGGLDDVQLRALQERLSYLRELHQRRASVLASIQSQGKLTPELAAALTRAATKQELEDLYLPFKPRRRTKGQIAREAGLEPLADALWADPTRDPALLAAPYVLVDKTEAGDDFTTLAAVLDGVRDLLAERWAETPALLQGLREWLWTQGELTSTRVPVRAESEPEVAKFRDYFDYAEPICRVPSHRALAVFRGRSLEILDVGLRQPADLGQPSNLAEIHKKQAISPVNAELVATKNKASTEPSMAEARLAQALGWRHQGRAADDFLRKCVGWTWRVKLSLTIERELFARLREQAEGVAIGVFAANLRDLLLAAPAGARVVMGLDPGIRTGVKVAVVDATGKLLETATVYPHEPRRDWDGALHTLVGLCLRHRVSLIAIGNGTASRETDRLAADLLDLLKNRPLALVDQALAAPEKVVVSEAGASVYSASEWASRELPEVDVSLRGAVSIARRLQDPLAELVKIDPKSIGVGQYQHDVNQSELARSLDAVVEDCVNAVGVDLNTASEPLLARVSGLSAHVAQQVVRWREAHGAFASRQDLLQVTGLGPKTFEQCAGFLRIRGGSNPLDMTGVHPEAYPLVEQILFKTALPVEQVLGRADVLGALQPQAFASPRFGLPTVQDIFAELEKPGRDPRGHFKVARFNEGVSDLADLRVGMVLHGTVSNVAAFGAFVDLGVHQDGLIHVSQLAQRFVRDAREVVKTGDIVQVQVLEVDVARRRIALTLKLGSSAPAPGPDNHFVPARKQPRAGHVPAPQSTAMSDAFAKLQRRPSRP
jgi:uncharacterized protein